MMSVPARSVNYYLNVFKMFFNHSYFEILFHSSISIPLELLLKSIKPRDIIIIIIITFSMRTFLENNIAAAVVISIYCFRDPCEWR